MAAGTSAHLEATRSLLEAEQLERMLRDARRRARNYQLASLTEASVGGCLTSLEALGWRVLADRRWAGSTRANVDFLLVGPGGVLVVDVKAWRDLRLVNGGVFCEDECRDDELDKLLGLTTRVQECLGNTGLAPQALRSVIVFAGRDVVARVGAVDLVGEANIASWTARLGLRLDGEEIDRLARELMRDFPPYDAAAPQRAVVVPPRTVLPRELPADDTLLDVDELTDSILEAALAKPIEDWMTFLHPDQVKLVSASWSGPARIRGPAGTGKTVVGLHRAAYLARRASKPVLFVTFVRTLPVVLGALCERLAPEARPRITFTSLHQLAVALLRDAGVTLRLDARKADSAFAWAWATVGRHTCLTALDERPGYWREEIDHVIKGRGLTAFEQYAELARIGRRTPMRGRHREAMWDLYVEYERRLRRSGYHDFNDVLIMAGDLVRGGQADPGYGSVIVDEVQDLDLVGLKLLKALAGEGPDRLLLLGDGQQAVYPGGFTLAEAGIGVTGRATVLRVNYRNTAAILDHAVQVVDNESFDDLDGSPVEARREVTVRRTGGSTPLTVRADDRRSLKTALVTQLMDAHEHLGVPWGDMAVLTQTRRAADEYRSVLRAAGVPGVDLLDYDGVRSDRVKVGTYKRAKGLEFVYVLLPGLVEGSVARWPGESEETYRERVERLHRELFVAMTRARDGLWLGYLPRRP